MVTDCDAMLIFSVAVGMDLVAVLMDPGDGPYSHGDGSCHVDS